MNINWIFALIEEKYPQDLIEAMYYVRYVSDFETYHEPLTPEQEW